MSGPPVHPSPRDQPVTAAVLVFNISASPPCRTCSRGPSCPRCTYRRHGPDGQRGCCHPAHQHGPGAGPAVDFGLPRTCAEIFYQLRTGVGWGLVALVAAITVALFNLAAGAGPPIGVDAQPELPLSWRIVFALWIVLGAPIGEELMFRGMLWGAPDRQRLREAWWSWLGNKWVILIVTAVLFALFHRENWRLPILVTGGIVLGIARLRSGSVAASTVAHSVNNTLPALAVVFAPMTLGGNRLAPLGGHPPGAEPGAQAVRVARTA